MGRRIIHQLYYASVAEFEIEHRAVRRILNELRGLLNYT